MILNSIKQKLFPKYKKRNWPGLINAYKSYLPVSNKTPIITLKEGNTPLIFSENLSNLIGIDYFVKKISEKEDSIDFVATDGHRLVKISKQNTTSLTGSFIIPKKFLSILNSLSIFFGSVFFLA